MRSVVLSAMLIASFAISSPSVSAQVQNGSFEFGEFISPGGWLVLASGSEAVDSWMIDQGSIDYIGGWWQASEGIRSIDLNGVNAGKVSQFVATVPGATYSVSFDMSGNPDGPPLEKSLTVTADGGNALTFFYDIGVNGSTRPDMRWASQQYTFVAQNDWTLLSFTSVTAGSYGPALDNVNVELVPVEEPTPLAGVCHRSNRKQGPRTLMVDSHAVPAHLAHGDTIGPCEE